LIARKDIKPMDNIKTTESQKNDAPAGQRETPCYVISASYGNDSIALLQFAKDAGLKNVHVVYCDTGWAHPDWAERVHVGQKLARSFGFTPHVVQGEFTFESMVRMKKGFPSQKMQFCSGILKIIPFNDFMEKLDPAKQAVVIIGKRRAESRNRANTPEFISVDKHQEGRKVWHPLYKHSDADRDSLIKKAGFDVLPHRSLECCPCVNANRQDLRMTPESQLNKLRKLEAETGQKLFRTYRHQGAWGIDEVMEWAHSGRGKYIKGQLKLWNYRGEICKSSLCGI
jgi:3'-phosphoadenosine 5'-phosphosulfate sulfotransferase (PAPS reductase)/FAD synthetase